MSTTGEDSPVSMEATAQAVADAWQVVEDGFRGAHPPTPEVRAAAFSLVLREFMDNEYTPDLDINWLPASPGTRR